MALHLDCKELIFDQLAAGIGAGAGAAKCALLKTGSAVDADTDLVWGDISGFEVVTDGYTAGGQNMDNLTGEKESSSPFKSWLESGEEVNFGALGATTTDNIGFVAVYKVASPQVVIATKAVTSKTTNGSTIIVAFPEGVSNGRGRVLEI